MDKVRLLIGSEESFSRRGLAAIFSQEAKFEVLGDYSLDEALAKSVQCQPDAILLDLGGDVTRHGQKVVQIRSECPCSLILVLIDDEQCNLSELLAQGIDGCIPRGIIRGCLVETVELACRTGLLCLPASFKKTASQDRGEVASINDLRNCPLGNGEYLTRRELEILQLMARNCSNRDIARKLFISEPTVKTHVSSVLRKLGQNNRAQAVLYSYKLGLIKEILANQA